MNRIAGLILAIMAAGVGLLLNLSTARPSTAVLPRHQPALAASTRFAIIGDYGLAGAGETGVSAIIRDWGAEFILTTGDNNYPAGASSTIDVNIGQYYAGYIGNYQGIYGSGAVENRFFPSPGNHDWIPGLQPYLDYFSLPGNERYYRTRQGAVEFFMLDSDSSEPDGAASDSIQAIWLQNALNDSEAVWKVVVFHHAPYSSGLHGNCAWMQWPFAAWGANAVVAGHDHTYERLEVDGIPYFVNGLGGASRYDFYTIPPQSLVRYNAAFGAMLGEVTPEVLVFSFVNVNGEQVDQIVLHQPAAIFLPLLIEP
ncbi:MAG TPA: metallophosphoesterase [Anaerolineaceae bacterium]|nr:metallophosphoesterase [Anaerolineaceae bacterium]HPN50147.1 metallophosphoesterase [Anaerolineaceae bacterium]